jgi:enoyl-[acyl-carrier protein] reductase II
VNGDIDSMDFLAGQSVGLVHHIKAAADIVHEIVRDAACILRNRSALAQEGHFRM